VTMVVVTAGRPRLQHRWKDAEKRSGKESWLAVKRLRRLITFPQIFESLPNFALNDEGSTKLTK
jgi:hypothetical protein